MRKNFCALTSRKNCGEKNFLMMNDGDETMIHPTMNGDALTSCRMNGDGALMSCPMNDGGDVLMNCPMNGDAHGDKTLHLRATEYSFRYGLLCNRKRKAYPDYCYCCQNYWVGSSLTNTPFTKYL